MAPSLKAADAPRTVRLPTIVVEGPIVRLPLTFTFTAPAIVMAAAFVKRTVLSTTVRAPKAKVAVVPALNVPDEGVPAFPTVTSPVKVSVTIPVLAVNIPAAVKFVAPETVWPLAPALKVPPVAAFKATSVDDGPIVSVPPTLTVTVVATANVVAAAPAKVTVASLIVRFPKASVAAVPALRRPHGRGVADRHHPP